MPTIPAQLDRLFRNAIQDAFDLASEGQIGVSQNEKFGDYQSNAAMGLAKTLAQKTGRKANPRSIAEEIVAKLKLGEIAAEVTIAGPGFINVRLSPAWLAKQLNAISGNARLGIAPAAEAQRIVVDYSGPNIAKEMHVGHLRSTIIGDAISRVLEFQGNTIIRQNHIGDWGTQFGRVVLAIWYLVLAEHLNRTEALQELVARMKEASDARDESAKAAVVHSLAELHRYFLIQDPAGTSIFEPRLKALKLQLPPLEALYQFVTAATECKAAETEMIESQTNESHSLASLPRLFTTFIQNPQDKRNVQEKLAWEKAREATLETCNEIYGKLGVKLAPGDVRGESAYQDDLGKIVAELKSSGIAVESEGAVVVKAPGYDSPLMIQKSDGGYLYGTTDLAAIRYRITRLGAADRLHPRQPAAATLRAGVLDGPADLGQGCHAGIRAVWNDAGGRWQAVQIAQRRDGEAEGIAGRGGAAGASGRDGKAARSAGGTAQGHRARGGNRGGEICRPGQGPRQRLRLFVRQGSGLDGNTAPYLQYAHARIRSIFRKAGDAEFGEIVLESPFELALAKHILRLGEIIDQVARELKPHHLCAYLYELAARFSGFFENCPVIQSPPPLRKSRLALCDLTARTLEVGLDLLGIEHPDQM